MFSWTRILGALIALAFAAAAPATASSHSAPTPVAHMACTRAIIVGQHKCIARGQYCVHTRRANRDYHRYGYRCGRVDRNGRYHLVYY